jgi:hypothetical protein
MSATIRKAGTYYVILISGAAALGGFLFDFGLGAAYSLYTIAAATSIFFVAFFIKEAKGMEHKQM